MRDSGLVSMLAMGYHSRTQIHRHEGKEEDTAAAAADDDDDDDDDDDFDFFYHFCFADTWRHSNAC